MDDMGTIYVDLVLENIRLPGTVADVKHVMVDTGSELSWIPRRILENIRVKPARRQEFIIADGSTIERDVGYALVRSSGAETVDDIVFGEPTDFVLLGCRTLEGLNLKIDVVRKQLVPAGPILAVPIAA